MTTKSTTPAVDQAFVDDFARRWAQAWNSYDPERVLELMADDVSYDDSRSPETMHGHDQVRVFLEQNWRAFPDLRFEVTDGPFLDPREPKAALYWRCNGTHLGRMEPPGLDATGRTIEIEIADFHEYREGKVARVRMLFDTTAVTRQLGVVPEVGSRPEAIAMGLANLRQKLRHLASRS